MFVEHNLKIILGKYKMKIAAEMQLDAYEEMIIQLRTCKIKIDMKPMLKAVKDMVEQLKVMDKSFNEDMNYFRNVDEIVGDDDVGIMGATRND